MKSSIISLVFIIIVFIMDISAYATSIDLVNVYNMSLGTLAQDHTVNFDNESSIGVLIPITVRQPTGMDSTSYAYYNVQLDKIFLVPYENYTGDCNLYELIPPSTWNIIDKNCYYDSSDYSIQFYGYIGLSYNEIYAVGIGATGNIPSAYESNLTQNGILQIDNGIQTLYIGSFSGSQLSSGGPIPYIFVGESTVFDAPAIIGMNYSWVNTTIEMNDGGGSNSSCNATGSVIDMTGVTAQLTLFNSLISGMLLWIVVYLIFLYLSISKVLSGKWQFGLILSVICLLAGFMLMQYVDDNFRLLIGGLHLGLVVLNVYGFTQRKG